MKGKIVLFVVFLLIIFMFGCKVQEKQVENATPTTSPPEVVSPPVEPPKEVVTPPPVNQGPSCPISCDDFNACTKDVCGYQTDYECRHTAMYPCCGNGICEASETEENCAGDCTFQEGPEFIQLIKNTELIKNYGYDYDLGTQVIRIFIRGSDAKIYYKSLRSYNGFAYDNLLRYGSNQTAIIYCFESCTRTTAKAVSIEDFPVPQTPLDLIKSLKSVKVVGTPNVEGKASMILESPLPDGSIRRITVWKFYGIPLVEEVWNADKTELINRTRFSNMQVNTISKDEFSLPIDPVLGPPVVT